MLITLTEFLPTSLDIKFQEENKNLLKDTRVEIIHCWKAGDFCCWSHGKFLYQSANAFLFVSTKKHQINASVNERSRYTATSNLSLES